MRAVWGDHVIAEAPEQDLIRIEGNWYFPPASVAEGMLVESPTPYTCPWKGPVQYYSLQTDEGLVDDAAFAYHELRPGAVDRVGQDFASYVAFSPSVQVVE
ncbi:DUF427 domain-containing protein [Microbacterium sp. LRZ72]|uniref:DUF427 domain-containing protein n=1 Tax=Microbacterium sp. LRZ72 TaxID=2942481 RepID=UPI0029BA7DA4|nr:DUF427 domain-containing protein [Microbacterium sp. LRZ72]MDX2375853.1 DUF427 domain-containing protein [Microbacterium sp. LRZ72]